jgi:hypothetical protein
MRTRRLSSSDSHKQASFPILEELGQNPLVRVPFFLVRALGATPDDLNAIANVATFEIPHPPSASR